MDRFKKQELIPKKVKLEKHEKLVTQYSKTFWTQITQIPQISSMDRRKPRFAGNPMQSIVLDGKPWETKTS